jgi:hypothetical protein
MGARVVRATVFGVLVIVLRALLPGGPIGSAAYSNTELPGLSSRATVA